ncbi:MAG: hypothetical protein KatS3mg088_472 [Patescibacteria group bacterium]|nr:MAG: hypothetical protein KatS3mg088_472 [Patescibacteria group bacterium]
MKKGRFSILLKKRKIILIALIYILSLSLRLIDLENTSIYSDEITWTVRGKEIIYALIHANKNFFENAWWKKTNDTEAIALPLTLLSGISQFFLAGNGKYSLKIFNDIFASRLPIAIISSLTPVFIFYFGSKLIGEKLALISAIFYLINPIAIAFDRMSINDSFLTLFSFTALTSYLYYSKENKISFIPGIFLSLAFLTKPNGILPIIGWLVYDLYQKRNNFPSKQLAINTISFLVFTNIMWPYSWEKPIYSIFEYLIRQFHLVQDGMTVFYRGKITTNPPFDFYLFQYLIRMPEILILGFFVNLISILYLIKNKNIKTKKQNITIITYVLIFLIIISISNKKLGIRYALPLLPWFVIASASGWLKILEILKKQKSEIHFPYFNHI